MHVHVGSCSIGTLEKASLALSLFHACLFVSLSVRDLLLSLLPFPSHSRSIHCASLDFKCGSNRLNATFIF